VPFRRFQHNFLRVNLSPTDRPLDLLDDGAWETLLANLRQAARIARAGRTITRARIETRATA